MQSGCRVISTSRMKAKDFNSYTVACSLIGKTMCFHVSWRFDSFRATLSYNFCLVPIFLMLKKTRLSWFVRIERVFKEIVFS